jgi:hypothetical protein
VLVGEVTGLTQSNAEAMRLMKVVAIVWELDEEIKSTAEIEVEERVAVLCQAAASTGEEGAIVERVGIRARSVQDAVFFT